MMTCRHVANLGEMWVGNMWVSDGGSGESPSIAATLDWLESEWVTKLSVPSHNLPDQAYDADRIKLDEAVAIGDVVSLRKMLRRGVRPNSPFVNFYKMKTLADYTTGSDATHDWCRPHVHEVRCGRSHEMPARELWTLLAAADAKFIDRHRIEQGEPWVARAERILASHETADDWPSPVPLPVEPPWSADDESSFADWAEVQSAIRCFVPGAQSGETAQPPPLNAAARNELDEPVEVSLPAEMVCRILEPSISRLTWRQIHRLSLICRAFRFAAFSVARDAPAENLSFAHTLDNAHFGTEHYGEYNVSVHAQLKLDELPAQVQLSTLGRFLPNRARLCRQDRERDELSFSTRTSDTAAAARATAFHLSPPILAGGARYDEVVRRRLFDRRGLLRSLQAALLTEEMSEHEASISLAHSREAPGEYDVWLLNMERAKEGIVHWLLANEFRAVAFTWSGEGDNPWDNGTDMGLVDEAQEETLIFALNPSHGRGVDIARLHVKETRTSPESEASDLDPDDW